jgi:predicted acetyltransferase
MGGISAVSTYPEARRLGLVKKMFLHHFEQMHKEDVPVSTLQPFKESFYSYFG